MFWPLNLIYPSTIRLSDINLPDKKFNKVVLPDPEGPKIAVKVYEGISPDCLCKITFYSFFILAVICVS